MQHHGKCQGKTRQRPAGRATGEPGGRGRSSPGQQEGAPGARGGSRASEGTGQELWWCPHGAGPECVGSHWALPEQDAVGHTHGGPLKPRQTPPLHYLNIIHSQIKNKQLQHKHCIHLCLWKTSCESDIFCFFLLLADALQLLHHRNTSRIQINWGKNCPSYLKGRTALFY